MGSGATVRYRGGKSAMSSSEIDRPPIRTETFCQSCKQPVLLELIASPSAHAWRMYNCPHCLKTNFLALPSAVLRARPGSQRS